MTTSTASNSLVVFGGTFDPFHTGHLSVVRSLLDEFPTVVLAPTVQNPWKARTPSPLEARLEMARLVLESEGLRLCEQVGDPGIFLSNFKYIYARDLVALLRTRCSHDIHWAVAEDQAEEPKKWKDWDSLGVHTRVLPITVDVHAEEIRAGKRVPHPAIEAYLAEHRLY